MESRSDLLETVAAERESVDSDTLEQGAAERRHSSHTEAPVLTRSDDPVTVLDRVEWARYASHSNILLSVIPSVGERFFGRKQMHFRCALPIGLGPRLGSERFFSLPSTTEGPQTAPNTTNGVDAPPEKRT